MVTVLKYSVQFSISLKLHTHVLFCPNSSSKLKYTQFTKAHVNQSLFIKGWLAAVQHSF